jgi:hypothetical protein
MVRETIGGYVKIKDIQIPLKDDMGGYNWHLALVTESHVYYWQNDNFEDIALMYSISNGKLEFISNNYFAYESMYEVGMGIVDDTISPLYISNGMMKTVQFFKEGQ